MLVQGFLYQGQLAPVAELDGSGQVVTRFTYATRLNVPDYMVKGGVTYRLVTDHLGSVRLVVNPVTGALAQRLDYDEFGRTTLDSNAGFQPFGFAGGITDSGTDLVRFGVRDYTPATARWTRKDPALFAAGSTSLYTYALNDPINLVDPDGLRPLTACEKDLLRLYFADMPFFDEIWDRMDLKERLPFWIPGANKAGGVQGHALGNQVYVDPVDYYGSTPNETVALIGHEVLHVFQYNRYALPTGFLARYGAAYVMGRAKAFRTTPLTRVLASRSSRSTFRSVSSVISIGGSLTAMRARMRATVRLHAAPSLLAGVLVVWSGSCRPPDKDAAGAHFDSILGLPYPYSDSALWRLPTDQQLDVLVWATVTHHPPRLGVSSSIGRQGRSVIPFVLSRLPKEGDDLVRVQLLSVIASVACSDSSVRRDSTVLNVAEATVRGLSDYRARGDDLLRDIKTGCSTS